MTSTESDSLNYASSEGMQSLRNHNWPCHFHNLPILLLITSRLKIRDKALASHWFSESFIPPGSQELFVFFNTSWPESLIGPPSPYLFSSKCELGVLLCLESHLVSKWFPQETKGCVLCRIQINMLQNLSSVW